VLSVTTIISDATLQQHAGVSVDLRDLLLGSRARPSASPPSGGISPHA
jgi:hypothetical protein